MEKKLTRTIKVVSVKQIESGQIGFLTDHEGEENVWRNVSGEPEILKELVKNIVAKGNVIEFKTNNGIVGNLSLIEKAPEKSKEGFDDITNFESLLNDAHKKFKDKLNIKTELVSFDYENKRAIFNASVSIENSDNDIRVFTAHGDAEGITNDLIKPHFIRMAETRAIARALRWATNNAKVAEEETENSGIKPN